MKKTSWIYWGFVPITILIGASVGAGGFGPFNIPPKWSQSPGHSCLTASKFTELKPVIRASQAGPTCPSVPDFKRTTIPVALPAPDQFHVRGVQFALLSKAEIIPARPFGSGPSPRMYIATFVPENFDKSVTKRGISDGGIVRGVFNLASANCASAARSSAAAARSLAPAIAARADSASAESRAVSLLSSAIRSSDLARAAFAFAVSDSSVVVRHSVWRSLRHSTKIGQTRKIQWLGRLKQSLRPQSSVRTTKRQTTNWRRSEGSGRPGLTPKPSPLSSYAL